MTDNTAQKPWDTLVILIKAFCVLFVVVRLVKWIWTM